MFAAAAHRRPSGAVEREIRLALVMNGGISLAVWMGGVTKEIDALRRASFLPRDPRPRGTARLWQVLLDGLGARLIVDIIAGTSAGGINGAILAAAIAHGQELPDLRDTWIETADFDSLLLERDSKSLRRSVLRGDLFTRELIRTFGARVGASCPLIAVEAGPPQEPPEDCETALWAEREDLRIALVRERIMPRAVTLVLTGTALRGVALGYRDETGQSFAYSDSRVRFTFRRDPRGITDDFADRPAQRTDEDPAPTASRRLARAARATASFPGAFEPAFINATDEASVFDPALGDVPEGPNMAKVTKLSASRWVIDGGVLDNEPFAPVLEELVRRPVDGDVRRILAYIVPSLGDPADLAPSDSPQTPPGIVETALAAVNLPRELDILDDLAQLRELQLRADVDRKQQKRLLEYVLRPGNELGSIAGSLYRLYRRRRLESSIWDSRATAATADRTEAADLRPLPTPADLDDDEFEATADRPWIPPQADQKVFPWDELAGDPTEDWRWGASVAIRFVRAMIGQVRDALAEGDVDATARTELGGVGLTLSACLAKLTELDETFRADVAKALGRDGAYRKTDAEVLELTEGCFRAVFGSSVEGGAKIGRIVRCASAATVGATGALEHELPGSDTYAKARALVRAFLRVEVLERTTVPTSAPPDVPRFKFHRVGLDAPTWYFDAELTPATKLAGTRYGHFGAFFKRAWRWYDWIWGRVDGSSQLVNMLFDQKMLEPAVRDESRLAVLRAAVVEVAGDSAGLPLDQMLKALADGDSERFDVALTDLRRTVARRIHGEVLRDELPLLGAKKEYESDLPSGLPKLDEQSSDEALRGALRMMHAKFTRTSLEDLTSDEQGREAKWLTIASAIRALSLDEHVPVALRGPLDGLAKKARLPGGRGIKGSVVRAGISAAGRGAGVAKGAKQIVQAIKFWR